MTEPRKRGPKPKDIAVRFWPRVEKHGPDECWPWVGTGWFGRNRDYGTIYHNGTTRLATHVSWEMHNGRPFPKGMMACHTCDNPPCVNPAHIFIGTARDNVRDAVQKGRFSMVGKNSRAKWTRCKRGHPLSGDNLTHHGDGSRVCRECRRIRNAKRYTKNKTVAFTEAMGGTL